MPSLGAGMEAGILAEWLVQPGAKVKRGDLIAVVETQKGAIDVEVFETGTVTRFLVAPGTEVPVGTPLALIDTGAAAPTPAAPAQVAPAPATQRAQVSPAARRRAEELGVDTAKLAAKLGGEVGIADVERAASKAPAAGIRPGMREAIAAAMAQSKREIPHYYLSVQLDFSAALDRLRVLNAALPVPERIVYGVLLVRAVALTVKRFPDFNGYFRNGQFEPSPRANVGVAISLRQGGLVAPALHDVDSKDLTTLMREFMDLVSRVRSGHMRSSEVAEPTITVSSLGEQGVDAVYPIIYPPQVAIVGFGTVVERPWAKDGQVAARRVLTATLAADHRVSDGHRGALFLDHLRKLLVDPERL